MNATLPCPWLRDGENMDVRGREIQRRVVGAAFRPVGMGVYPLDDSRAAAVPAGRVESFKDFRESRGQGVH